MGITKTPEESTQKRRSITNNALKITKSQPKDWSSKQIVQSQIETETPKVEPVESEATNVELSNEHLKLKDWLKNPKYDDDEKKSSIGCPLLTLKYPCLGEENQFNINLSEMQVNLHNSNSKVNEQTSYKTGHRERLHSAKSY
jgi:hypothetical protein